MTQKLKQRISYLENKLCEVSLDFLTSEGQAAESYEAQLAAEAKLAEFLKKSDGEIMTERSKILAKADDLVNGERQAHYGSPQENFLAIAEMWSAYLGHDMSPADVCHMMTLLKIARLRNGPHHDSSVDACGYMSLGGELGC